jgi:hypothetical protein
LYFPSYEYIYTEVKKTRRRVADAMKENREECKLIGEYETGKRRGGMVKENPKTRCKMQRGRD